MPRGPELRHRRRLVLWCAFRGECAWCRRPTIIVRGGEGRDVLPFEGTSDHELPRARGGRDRLDNQVLACHECNNERGSRLVEDWRRSLIERGFRPMTHDEIEACRARGTWRHPTGTAPPLPPLVEDGSVGYDLGGVTCR